MLRRCTAWMVAEWNMSIEWRWHGKEDVFGKSVSQCHFLHYKSHANRPGFCNNVVCVRVDFNFYLDAVPSIKRWRKQFFFSKRWCQPIRLHRVKPPKTITWKTPVIKPTKCTVATACRSGIYLPVTHVCNWMFTVLQQPNNQRQKDKTFPVVQRLLKIVNKFKI